MNVVGMFWSGFLCAVAVVVLAAVKLGRWANAEVKKAREAAPDLFCVVSEGKILFAAHTAASAVEAVALLRAVGIKSLQIVGYRPRSELHSEGK